MDDRPRYMISVAAELVGMHPQTLRIYEQKGLVRPRRTPGNTRLYSEPDLERLRLIQRLTTELGLNLAGVERVLRLEDELRAHAAPHRAARARDARGGRSTSTGSTGASSCSTEPTPSTRPEEQTDGLQQAHAEVARRRSAPPRSWRAAAATPRSTPST